MAAMIGFVSLVPPAAAHEGLVHEGCAAGQTFAAGDVTITGAFTRAMLPQAKTGGGYMLIINSGAEADRLLAATSEAAKVVQLHLMQLEGEVMKMKHAETGVEIPAGGTVSLAPGGMHVMLLGVGVPFKEGECLELTLEFEKAGKVPVLLNVGGVSAEGPPEHHGH